MKPFALFPGQGAQYVGMMKDVLENEALARDRFEEASETLGFDLTTLCIDGPEDKLNATNVCQPALLVSSLVLFELMNLKLGWKVEDYEGMAGLSLGEITALCAAGSLEFADAVKVVEARGRFMQEACDREVSSMTSVIGFNHEEASSLAKEIAGESGILIVANVNAPTQMVFSGDIKLLDVLANKVGEMGKRAIPLKVAGAFHSAFMKPADDQLSEVLAGMHFKTPCVPVWSNVDGQPHGDEASIRDRLARQVVSPVLWTTCMSQLPAEGLAYEIGAGRVLSGLMRKINRQFKVVTVGSLEDLQALTGKEAEA